MKTFFKVMKNIFKYWGFGLIILLSLLICFGLIVGVIGLFILLISSKSIIAWIAAALLVGGVFGFIAYDEGKRNE